MFETRFIYELTSGQLTDEGYRHLLSGISHYVRKYKWPKSIVVSKEIKNSQFWSVDEIGELTHQFLEWSLSKGKFDKLDRVPVSYLSYYFSQILISFVANRIKEEQQKEGLSYEKCREIVTSICRENFNTIVAEGKEFVFTRPFSKDDLYSKVDDLSALSYLPKIPIKKSTKHFRPLVEIAVKDIFTTANHPIFIKDLITLVWDLFDQKGFFEIEDGEKVIIDEDNARGSGKFDLIIKSLIKDISREDAQIISNCLFLTDDKLSLSDLAQKYNIPKSTLHYKLEAFKKKISSSYSPENEKDGILFLQNISVELDKLSK